MKIKEKAVFAFALIVFCTLLVIVAFGYNSAARLLPVIIGLVTIIMLIIQFLMEISPAISKRLDALKHTDLIDTKNLPFAIHASTKTERNVPGELRLIAWLFFIGLLLYFLDYIFAIPIFLIAFFKIESKIRWSTALFSTAVTWAGTFVLFRLLLNFRM